MSFYQIIQIISDSYTMMLKAMWDLKDADQTVPSGLAAGGISKTLNGYKKTGVLNINDNLNYLSQNLKKNRIWSLE